jgi:phosphoglycerate dehydrogenase-like enzyme
MTVTVLNSVFKPLLETRLPSWVDARWYADKDEAFALAPAAEIGWFDMYSKDDMAEVFTRAAKLKWLNSVYAGVEAFPLDLLSQRGVMLTNGAGINAVPIAEYVLMLMLAQAKGYREVVRAQERREWLKTSPGKRELFGSQVLILGYGAIGQEVEARLAGFGAHVTKVRRSAGPGTLGPEEWRAQLGMFDWIVGALLDVTTPEPLPPEHPLWTLDNAQVTMHLSGNAQTLMFQRAATRFLANLERYRAGEPLTPLVDYAAGY